MERARAERLVREAVLKLRGRVGPYAYGEGDDDLAAVVLEQCRRRGLKLAVAESCTGGLLGERITNIPGSSDVFLGGVIAYHDDIKREVLGVEPGDIARHGAVSEEVALQMATGAKTRLRAGIGIGITGVAGPGGGTPEKPVGLVWIAVDISGARARRFQMIGDRAEIRQRAAQAALEMVRRALSNGELRAMRNSKKKPDTQALPDQETMGSADDYAPGASQGDGQSSDPTFGSAEATADAGSAGASADVSGSDRMRADSDVAGERERYLRLAAEYDNYRKRSMRERQDAGARAQGDLVRELVESLDDVARFAHVD